MGYNKRKHALRLAGNNPHGGGVGYYNPPFPTTYQKEPFPTASQKELAAKKKRGALTVEDIMDQEAKYWRDKWLESQRVAAALRDLFTKEGKPKQFEKSVKEKKKK